MPDSATQLLGALGLCRKAGKLLWGSDRVQEAVLRGKVYLVLLACDASERTRNRFTQLCEEDIPLRTMPLTTAQLAALPPRPAAVFAVTDANFARLCAKHLKVTSSKEEPAHGV